MIVHQHLVAAPLVEEENVELEGIHKMLVVGDLVEKDGHVTVDSDLVIIIRLLVIISSSVRKECQIPSGLLPVRLKSKIIAVLRNEDQDEREETDLDRECAGLNAVVSLDALLLPLVV